MTRLNPHRVQPSTVRVWRLYRAWRADGTLLYIGQTGREPLARLIEHLYEQQWAHEIARWEVDPHEYRSEAEVLAAELAAIRAERPIRNWVGNEGPHRQWLPKVGEYRHPGRRRPAAERSVAGRVLTSPVTWRLAAWTAVVAVCWWLAGWLADQVGRGMPWQLHAGVAFAVPLAGWLWWLVSGRRRWRRWMRRL